MRVNPDIATFLQRQKTVTLGFSTGKDSLACAVICRELGVHYIPIFFYICPELDFIEKNLRMYEKLLGIEIVRLPHPMLYDFLRHQDFQPPKMIEFLATQCIPKFGFAALTASYLEYIGDNNEYYDVVGMRSAESFNRRKVFEKTGPIDHDDKKIYPIYDWKKDDVLQYLHINNMPLTDDYKIWNRSYDNMKYQFLFGLKKHYPNDYDKLREYFPLIDLELFRYECNRRYF